jgi:hypothetical protein
MLWIYWFQSNRMPLGVIRGGSWVPGDRVHSVLRRFAAGLL